MYCVCSSLLHAVCDITLGCCGYLQGNRGTEQVLGRQCEFVGFQGERLQDCQTLTVCSGLALALQEKLPFMYPLVLFIRSFTHIFTALPS